MQIPEYQNYQEGKKHGRGTFLFDTYLCTIPQDFQKVPIHWHEDIELIYVKKGEQFDPKSHITEVFDKNQKAIGKEQVVITSYADLSVPGCYQYKFEVTDEKGVQGSTYLVVIVEE